MKSSALMKEDTDDPISTNEPNRTAEGKDSAPSFFGWLKSITRGKNPESVRDVLLDYIHHLDQDTDPTDDPSQEKNILANILKIRDLTVFDVMIPRTDIVAIEMNTTQEELLDLLSKQQYSRLPVYRENLDDIAGSIHIKDILASLAKGKRINIRALIRDVPIVSPALPVLDLLHVLRAEKRHMALVIDEFGGIDGLVTIGDVLENLVGQIDDEHEIAEVPQIVASENGTYVVNARVGMDDFEEFFGKVLDEDDNEDIETVGGLVFYLAGQVPENGEIINHPESGLRFEIIDADRRRINSIRIHKDTNAVKE